MRVQNFEGTWEKIQLGVTSGAYSKMVYVDTKLWDKAHGRVETPVENIISFEFNETLRIKIQRLLT